MLNLSEKIQETFKTLDSLDKSEDMATRIERFDTCVNKTSLAIKGIVKKHETRVKLLNLSLAVEGLETDSTAKVKDYIDFLIDRLNTDNDTNLDSEKMKFREFENWVCSLDGNLKDSNQKAWRNLTTFINASDIEKIIEQNRNMAFIDMQKLETYFDEIREYINKIPDKPGIDLSSIVSKFKEINKLVEKYGVEKPAIVVEFFDKLNKRRYIGLNELPMPVYLWLSERGMLKDFKIQFIPTK